MPDSYLERMKQAAIQTLQKVHDLPTTVSDKVTGGATPEKPLYPNAGATLQRKMLGAEIWILGKRIQHPTLDRLLGGPDQKDVVEMARSLPGAAAVQRYIDKQKNDAVVDVGELDEPSPAQVIIDRQRQAQIAEERKRAYMDSLTRSN